MLKQFITKTIIKSVIRHSITFLAGILFIKGLASHEQIDVIVKAITKVIADPDVIAAVAAIGAITHSAIEKNKSKVSTEPVKQEAPVSVVSEPLKSPRAS